MKETKYSTMEAVDKNVRDKKAYTIWGALLVFLPVIPIVAAIISIAVYIWLNLKEPGGIKSFSWLEAVISQAVIPLLVGTLPTLLLWFLLACIFRPFTAVFSADEKSYNALLNHLSTVDSYIDVLPEEMKKVALDTLQPAKLQKPGISNFRWLFRWLPFGRSSGATSVQSGTSALAGATSVQSGTSAPAGATSSQPPSKDTSVLEPEQELLVSKQELLRYRNAFYSALMQRSTSWITGNGYIELWGWMDSAEEALIIFAPLEKVVADAVYDEMRLNDSEIKNSEEWANKLRSALMVLDPDAVVRYLKPAAGAHLSVGGAATQQQAPQAANGAEAQQHADARAILRDVRGTINDFNIKSWGGLISARNQLLSTMIFVGLTTYVFVELAILFQVKPLHIEVAIIYAFIGGLSGLIGRLSTEAPSGQAIDDYRLSMARLMVTPLLSGLAAVIGVLLVAKASNLDMIYNFNVILQNLIIAATFGLTPNLLINQLKNKSDEYKTNLQSTQPTTGK
jgi:hypothetical protein